MSEKRSSRIEQLDEIKRLERNGLLIAIVTTLVAAVVTVMAVVFKFTSPWTVAPIFLAGLIGIWLVRSGRYLIASWVIISAGVISSAVEVFLRSGEGINRGAIGMVFIGGYALFALPRRLIGRTLLIALLVGISIILIDIFGPVERISSPQTPQRIVITLFTLAVFAFFVAKEFSSLDLQTKIVLGILTTGGMSLGVLAFFAINRSTDIINSLSNRLETSVSLLAEEQLINKVSTEAEQADHFFNGVKDYVVGMAQYRVALQSQQKNLSQGAYWDASTKLIQLDGGQYGNPRDDRSSVFVPAGVPISDAVLTELNISSYMDFYTPQLIEEKPELLALYYIDTHGVFRYYPNIDVASILPPDYNATKRPYYENVTPKLNPQRLTIWADPYIDAAGGGLVVTVASPVYYGNTFGGITAADVQLTKITEQISSIKVGQSGYAFLIDGAGRIISMPTKGYGIFGIDPNTLPTDEFSNISVFERASDEVDAVTSRMAAGTSGLDVVTVNDVDTYITYSQLKSTGYIIAIVVPVSEMQSAVILAGQETQAQTQAAVRTAAIILVILLLGSMGISLVLGQIIVMPVRRLNETAGRIAGGELTAQAVQTTSDEIGTLAESFNIMTLRLRETLQGLETRVDERTSELVSANERNERRAEQFEAIARVSRTISSTNDLDNLLAQISTVISREFGFYHVGIFLLDSVKEYAVLSASNSEGGQVMLARSHRLKVGEKGLVGFVSSTGRPRVALDTGADAVFFDNPDLPNTRSEIALPLRTGENIIGVLDVQSIEPNAFSQEDVNILSTLAEQVGIAIQNARQNEETNRALAESEALSRQFVQSGWGQFTKRQNLLGVRHTGTKATLLYADKNAKEKDGSPKRTSQVKAKGGAVLSLPIKLRGEVIGSVDVRSPEQRQWDQDEIDIVTAIIERAAIAMENSRLLEDAQRRVSREQAIGEMSANIGTFTDTEAILRATVNEIAQKIGGTKVVFELGTQDEDKKRSKSK